MSEVDYIWQVQEAFLDEGEAGWVPVGKPLKGFSAASAALKQWRDSSVRNDGVCAGWLKYRVVLVGWRPRVKGTRAILDRLAQLGHAQDWRSPQEGQ